MRSWASSALSLFLLAVEAFIEGDDIDFDLEKALKMVIQVLTLMPLRTVMNYQYRFGTTMSQAISTLYADGGWTRYYQGLTAALIQGPASRFGDTASNAGILALFYSNTVMLVFESLVAAFRMILHVKTMLQTHSSEEDRSNDTVPSPQLLQRLVRRAFAGFCASVTSDTISNSLCIVRIGYVDVAYAVIAVDGLRRLFGRGLKTRSWPMAARTDVYGAVEVVR
ncbi:hypothetical protein C8F01DRAFT_1215774 [Mycena amicta]|nr:hypothetical protein C8F01DRAFT_1215774 [Mycena amicta]